MTSLADGVSADRQQSGTQSFGTVRDRKDALALQALAPLSSAYVPWTISAMRPSGVAAVLNEITVNRRRRIVELGSGVSTTYIGRLLARRGGHLWSVEHDERWADRMEQELASEGLGEVVTLVRAPLRPIRSPWPDVDPHWYDRGRLAELTAGQPIDLLLVDGPPAFEEGRRHSRYPAVPFFAPMLADDYTIVLDDVDRDGEQEIMERWGEELGITFQRRLASGGIGIGRPREAFTI